MDAEALAETLKGVAEGDANALERILPIVYQELRRLAAGYLKGERIGHTLQPTALAHEAYLRLVGRRIAWQGRNHFMGVAAHAMRSVLVDTRGGATPRSAAAARRPSPSTPARSPPTAARSPSTISTARSTIWRS